MELAKTALLRALATEHRLGVVALERSGALRHQVVLDHRAHNAGGSLGAKRQTLFGLKLGVGSLIEHAREVGARKDAEHLLAHDVRGLADAVDEYVYLLNRGRFDGSETVGAKDLRGDLLHVLPGAHVAPDKIAGSLCFLSLHDFLSRLAPAFAQARMILKSDRYDTCLHAMRSDGQCVGDALGQATRGRSV